VLAAENVQSVSFQGQTVSQQKFAIHWPKSHLPGNVIGQCAKAFEAITRLMEKVERSQHVGVIGGDVDWSEVNTPRWPV
jgi:hypothetical protein